MLRTNAVLVVDDDDALRDMLRALLERRRYHVLTARNGRDALQVLSNVHVAVVLLDLAMPEMDGWEFLERKAADLSIAAVPVIVVTGTEEALAPVTMSRVELVLRKPLRNGDLLAAVARFLAVPGSAEQSALIR